MATTFISINTGQRLGAQLRSAVDTFQAARQQFNKLKAVMDTQIDGSDYSLLESQFGIPTGKGQTAYNLVAQEIVNLAGTNENQLLAYMGWGQGDGEGEVMRIEAVSVCVGYGDFLAETAVNRNVLDRWMIVTTPSDQETREVCRKHNLDVVLTDEFARDGDGDFAKVRGINKGLDQLSANAWRVHLDADIVLPGAFRHLVEASHPDPACIYGADRAMVRNWEEWQRFKASKFLAHDYHCRVQFPPGLPVGDRWSHPTDGYVPIGYFQMWHADADEHAGIRLRRYPERHNTAARCDVQFAKLWDRRLRRLLPELIVVHLESEQAKTGANWKGRTTKRFGPDCKPQRPCPAS